MDPDDAVASGVEPYQDVTEQLALAGLTAVCAQTPQAGLALVVALDDAQVLLVTEADGPLPRRREDHRSWGVSLYAGVGGGDERLLAWDAAQDGAVPALMPLISGVLLDTMRGPSRAS